MSEIYKKIMDSFNQRKREIDFSPQLLDDLSVNERTKIESMLLMYCQNGADDVLKYLPFVKTINVRSYLNDDILNKMDNIFRNKIYCYFYIMYKNLDYLNKVNTNFIDVSCAKLLYECYKESKGDASVYLFCRDIFSKYNYKSFLKKLDSYKNIISTQNDNLISGNSYNQHAYTPEIVKSQAYLLKWKYYQISNGVKLELNNDKNYNYYVLDNGIYFRVNILNQSIEFLDLNLMQWVTDEDKFAELKTGNIQFQELKLFEDYFKKKVKIKLDNDIIKSGIIGFAVGDALGVPVEFTSRESRKKQPINEMLGYGSHKVPEGTWSDDTSMSIAFMDSVIECGSINYDDIMSKFCDWMINDNYTATNWLFDIGITTRNALSSFYTSRTNALNSGEKSENCNGNGSLMRMLPVAMYLYFNDYNDDEETQIINNLSSLTHAHEISMLGCKIFCDYMKNIFDGKSIEEAYEKIKKNNYKKYYSDYAVNKFSRILQDDIRSYDESEISSSGYVVSSLEASLWCTLNSSNYEDAVKKAVNLGNDTDTIGAIVGGINGCVYGYSSIPDRWLSKLKKREYLEDLSNSFFETINLKNVNTVSYFKH